MLTERQILDILEKLEGIAGDFSVREKRVKIRTKERCSVCGKAFTEVSGIGLVCLRCKTIPRRYFIDLHWEEKRVRVYSDRNGQPLSSYEQAKRLASIIELEIQQRTFDPSKYVAGDIKRFLFKNLVEQYLSEKEKIMSPSGFQAKESWFKHRIVPFFAAMDVREIRGYHLHEFYEKLIQEETISLSSVKKIFVELKAFLNWCLKREILEKLPAFPEVKAPNL